MTTSPTFIYKGYTSILDSDMSVCIANESDLAIILSITLFIRDTNKILETFMLEMNKKDIEDATATGTLVTSIEQGYLEMLQEEKDREVEIHKECDHYMGTQEWMH